MDLAGRVPFPWRVAHAVVSYVVYIEKMIWPTKLSPHYVHPYLPGGTPWATWQIIGAALLLLVLSVLAARMSSRRYLMVGWLWYLGTLAPVIGLVQLGKPGLADRYTYVPLIGLFLIIAWGGRELLSQWPARQVLLRRVGLTCAIVVIATCMASSWWHARNWRNSMVFFTHALEVSPTNAYLHNNYGVVLLQQGRQDEAVSHFRQALQIKADLAYAHRNLSIVLQGQGKYGEALQHDQEAQRIESSWSATGDESCLPQHPADAREIGPPFRRRGRAYARIAL
jgi:protein O-mannosyl-transferase